MGGSGKGVQGARELGEAAHRLPGPPARGSSWSFAPPARFGDAGLEAGPVRPSRLPAALGATLLCEREEARTLLHSVDI